MSDRLRKARRLVVKIGSALLVDSDSGRLKSRWLASLAADLAEFHERGAGIMVVSSGSIALGARRLGLTPKSARRRLDESQAAAAVGQIALAEAWSGALGRHGMVAGQVLLTIMDTEERRRYLNARDTLDTLLRHRAVPVINENDTVATDEIRYGDNDRLAARVASMMHADCLVLLSDVDGLYSAPPGTPGAEHLAEVTSLDDDIMAMAGDSGSAYGSGGMKTKLEAARIATGAGVNMVIASGRRDHPLRGILDGARATWFTSATQPLAARKRWLAGSLVPSGELVVDAGAVAALRAGKSLLPVGVVGARGDFSRGDAVRIIGEDGRELARGLINYDHREVERIRGRRSADIAAILGHPGRGVVIHRDDLAWTGQRQDD